VERAVYLENTSERMGTGLKQASDDFSRFVEGDFAAHLTDYKSLVVSKHVRSHQIEYYYNIISVYIV
jgi:hypothetical protein